MLNGTWVWFEWASLFVLLTAIAVSAVSTQYILMEKNRPVLAAIGLAAWIYGGISALIIFGHAG